MDPRKLLEGYVLTLLSTTTNDDILITLQTTKTSVLNDLQFANECDINIKMEMF